MIYFAQLDLDKLMSSRKFSEKYYKNISVCYNREIENDVDFEGLQNCLLECKKRKKEFEILKENIYYMSLFSLQTKMKNCFKIGEFNKDEFLDCEWTAFSKVKRKFKNWWEAKIDKICDKMENK